MPLCHYTCTCRYMYHYHPHASSLPFAFPLCPDCWGAVLAMEHGASAEDVTRDCHAHPVRIHFLVQCAMSFPPSPPIFLTHRSLLSCLHPPISLTHPSLPCSLNHPSISLCYLSLHTPSPPNLLPFSTPPSRRPMLRPCVKPALWHIVERPSTCSVTVLVKYYVHVHV